MVTPRTLLLVWLALTALGCTSLSEPIQESEDWKETWKQRAAAAAEGAADGAEAVGESLSVAARGVVNGFEDPDLEAFGAYPKGYPGLIRRHLTRFEAVPGDASFRFGRPAKGYMNKGLLLGGGIAWQGWLVDVDVEIPSRFDGQQKTLTYTVRMRDGEVVEVHDTRYTASLRRAEPEPAPGALAITD